PLRALGGLRLRDGGVTLLLLGGDLLVEAGGLLPLRPQQQEPVGGEDADHGEHREDLLVALGDGHAPPPRCAGTGSGFAPCSAGAKPTATLKAKLPLAHCALASRMRWLLSSDTSSARWSLRRRTMKVAMSEFVGAQP